jgi:hypothetical protein
MSRENARSLRNDMTHAERLLWKYLSRNQLGVRFRRQVPIGWYIVDFVCFYPPIVRLGAIVEPIIVNFLTIMLHYLLAHQVILKIIMKAILIRNN